MIKLIHSLKFAVLILVSLVLGSPFAALAAQLYHFDGESLANFETFKNQVFEFKEGDQIRITNSDQTTVDLRLKRYLGEGAFGRVFLLDDMPEHRIVKFQYGVEKSREAMHSELKALNTLKSLRVPHSEVLEANPDFYLIKEFVPGWTLYEWINEGHWDSLSARDQSIALFNIFDLRKQLLRHRISFTDLNTQNIMMDQNHLDWKIVDPGSLLGFSATSSGDLGDFSAVAPFNRVRISARDPLSELYSDLFERPELETAFRWLKERRNRDCVEPFLLLSQIESELENEDRELISSSSHMKSGARNTGQHSGQTDTEFSQWEAEGSLDSIESKIERSRRISKKLWKVCPSEYRQLARKVYSEVQSLEARLQVSSPPSNRIAF